MNTVYGTTSFVTGYNVSQRAASGALRGSSMVRGVSMALSSMVVTVVIYGLLVFGALELRRFFTGRRFSNACVSSGSHWVVWCACGLKCLLEPCYSSVCLRSYSNRTYVFYIYITLLYGLPWRAI